MTQRAVNLPYKCALKSDNILNILILLLGNTVIKKFSASSVCLHSLCQWSNSKTAFCPMLQSKNIVFLFVVHLSQPFRLFYNRSAKQASPRYAHCVEMLGVQGWPMWTLGCSVCSEPAAKKIQPSPDENPYNWPKPAHMASSSSTLHCQWECRIQMEKVKQRKAADLTDDAATYPTGLCEKKKKMWFGFTRFWAMAGNEAAHLTWIMFHWVVFFMQLIGYLPFLCLLCCLGIFF